MALGSRGRGLRAVTVAAWILTAVAGAAVGRLALPRSGLRGHYYTNLTRSGAPVAVAIDQSLSTDTLDNGTAGVWPAYSVEWTGYLVIDAAGVYEFSVISDDGSELEVADQIVVQNGGRHGPQEARGAINLRRGLHPIRLRYEQAGGGFWLAVNIGRQGERLAALPGAMLLPDAMSDTAYRLRGLMPLAGAIAAMVLFASASHVLKRRGPPAWLSTPIAPLDRPGQALAIVIVIALAVRIVMMLGSNAILWGDSDVFLESFGNIRNGRFLEHDAFRTLLYPYFLTAFLIWSGEPPMDQVIVGAQHLLGVLSAMAFFHAGRAAFGTRVALAGAVVFALHTTQLFYEASILSESFFVCLLGWSLLVCLATVRSPSVPRAVAAGLACVALTMTRPIAQYFLAVPLVLTMVAVSEWRRRLTIAFAMVAVYAALMLPWAALNQSQFGFFGVALGRGLGLFIRTFEIDRYEPPRDTKYPEVQQMLSYAQATQFSPATYVRDELRRQHYSVAMADDLMYRASVEAIRDQPSRFIVGTVRQWWRMLGGPLGDEKICASPEGPYVCTPRTVGYAREPFLNRPRHADEPLREWVVAYFRHFRIPMHVVSALAVFGAVACFAFGAELLPALLLVLTASYFSLLPAVAQSPQDRYRLPADAMLFILAVFGLSVYVRRLFAADSSEP